MADYCPQNGKECFSTRGAALRAARRLGSGSVYRCNYCHEWHITHYSFEHSKAIRELYRKGYYTVPQKSKRKDMRIFIDTAFNDSVEVTIQKVTSEEEPPQTFIGLYIGDGQNRRYTALTYDQALELVEALKIQIAKL